MCQSLHFIVLFYSIFVSYLIHQPSCKSPRPSVPQVGLTYSIILIYTRQRWRVLCCQTQLTEHGVPPQKKAAQINTDYVCTCVWVGSVESARTAARSTLARCCLLPRQTRRRCVNCQLDWQHSDALRHRHSRRRDSTQMCHWVSNLWPLTHLLTHFQLFCSSSK